MTHISKISIGALFFGIISMFSAQKRETFREKKIEEIVISGKSSVKKIQQKAYNVSVIDADKYKNTTLDIGHVLDKVSGIRVRETGGVGSEM